MSTWHNTIPAAQLPVGQKHALDLEGHALLLVHIDDGIYAIENRCTHADAELTEGELEDNDIVCPWHGARFCVKTGEVTCPPAFEDIETYPVRVQDGVIQVAV